MSFVLAVCLLVIVPLGLTMLGRRLDRRLRRWADEGQAEIEEYVERVVKEYGSP